MNPPGELFVGRKPIIPKNEVFMLHNSRKIQEKFGTINTLVYSMDTIILLTLKIYDPIQIANNKIELTQYP